MSFMRPVIGAFFWALAWRRIVAPFLHGLTLKLLQASGFSDSIAGRIHEAMPLSFDLKVNPMRILVVEDEQKTADYVQQGLSESGYVVDCAPSGVDGLHLARQHRYELVILDVNLPNTDGWEVLEQLRRDGDQRVMMLTARGRLADKIKGLDMGADDYLVKPFEFPELLARVRTLLRRSEHIPLPEVLRVADLELDPRRHRAYRGNRRIDLTTKEFALLHVLMRQTGEVMTRTQIISLVWDMNFDCDTNVVEVSISRLRAKVDDQSEVKLIHTIRGVGYVLEARQ